MIIKPETRFKVTFVFVFSAKTCPREIGAANKCTVAINDNGFGVYAWV